MIKNATVQLPEIQVVKVLQRTSHCEPAKARHVLTCRVQWLLMETEAAAERMGHTAIATLIRNTRQKIAESGVRQAEEERLGLVALLATVPEEDWCRTWPACGTIMFRRTSKIVKEQVDKMRLPAVVCLYKHWRSTRPSLIEQTEIVEQAPFDDSLVSHHDTGGV
jgi:hypothetical protein